MNSEDDYGFFHVCTNGTMIPWMFRDEEDFRFGMNRIGVCSLLTGASILVFTLMDNHTHFMLYGTRKQCQKFIDKYKLLTGKWISHKYGITKYLKHLPVSIIPLRTEDDILETAAYIDRNPIVAGFTGTPYEYPWGSCRFMFKKSTNEYRHMNMIKDFTSNELRGILKSRIRFPANWTFDNNGKIEPTCFTDINRTETLFKTPSRHLYYLVKKLEGKINQTLNEDRPLISDKDMRDITANLAFALYKNNDIRTLKVDYRLAIARRLKRDYTATVKQLSRILYLDASVLKDFI